MKQTSLLIGMLCLVVNFQGKAQVLEDYQWRYRILVLVFDSSNAKAAQAQKAIFLQAPEELQERDLLIFKLADGALFNENEQKIGYRAAVFPDADFRGLILLGKDGGVKLKKTFPVDPKTIYTLIDSMPMRQAEIKRNKKY